MKKEWDTAVKALKRFGDETGMYVYLKLEYGQHSKEAESEEYTIYKAYTQSGGHTEECLTPMDAVIQCINKYKEEVKKRA
jgi:hypothetical protein